MCSFIISNFTIENIEYVNFFNKKRGPDRTNKIVKNGVEFIHNLLSITGEFRVQPFIDNDIVCLYNGEIYNYKNIDNSAESDGKILIPLYKKYGKEFVKKIDGEFSIVLYDFQAGEIIVATDTFSTKPLWFGLKQDGKYCFSSYKSVLDRLNFTNVRKVEPNRVIVLDIKTLEIKNIDVIKKFDLDNQIKTSYDDVIVAFENSIKKRTQNLREKIFIGLSSGYDSGMIACELIKQNINFKSFSIKAEENIQVIEERHKILKTANKEVEKILLSRKDFEQTKSFIKQNCEEFKYEIKRSGFVTPGEFMTDDKGAVGLGFICKKAIDEGIKIYLSGQGADEIISDYGFNGKKYYNHSTIGGLFPEDLKKVFPWNNFYKGTQISYLGKEENISGGYGIEGRYPFLDFEFVQEFLWLNVELKNANYKSVLFEYLRRNKFPFEENKKIGFSCDKNLL